VRHQQHAVGELLLDVVETDLRLPIDVRGIIGSERDRRVESLRKQAKSTIE